MSKVEDMWSDYTREGEQLTLREIGRAYGISYERVRQLFHDNGYPVRTRLEAQAIRRRRERSKRSP